MFDHVSAELDAETNDVNRYRVHTAVAKAIILLAGAGQLDPIQLKLYATPQGRSAIFR